MKNLFVLSLLVVGLSACHRDFRLLEAPNAEKVYYSSLVNVQRVAISGYAKVISHGQVLIVLGIDNQSADTLIVSESAQLQTGGGLRSEIKIFERYKSKILPHTFDTLMMVFAPINNLEVFHRSGYQGDFVEEYLLDLSFIEGFSDQVLKYRAGNWWSDYKEKSQEGQMEYFVWQLDTTAQRDWQISETEILSKGVLFKTKAFKIQDSLSMNMELINHGEVEIGIFLSKLQTALQGAEQEKESRIFWLPKGSRWEHKLTVYFPSDSLNLPSDLMIDKFNQALWPSGPRLIKVVD